MLVSSFPLGLQGKSTDDPIYDPEQALFRARKILGGHPLGNPLGRIQDGFPFRPGPRKEYEDFSEVILPDLVIPLGSGTTAGDEPLLGIGAVQKREAVQEGLLQRNLVIQHLRELLDEGIDPVRNSSPGEEELAAI